MLVKVKFPDGVREVEGFIYLEEAFYDFSGMGNVPSMPVHTPYEVPGYRFERVMGIDYQWVAVKE